MKAWMVESDDDVNEKRCGRCVGFAPLHCHIVTLHLS